jgi:hypothetical protein
MAHPRGGFKQQFLMFGLPGDLCFRQQWLLETGGGFGGKRAEF